MRLRWGLLSWLPVALLAGCGVKQPETLASLPERIELPRLSSTPQSVRSQAVSSYRDLLAEAASDSARPEVLRRLADLRLDEGAEQESGLGRSALNEAVNLYRRILNQHVDFALTDSVLYQLARGYDYLGQPAKVLESLTQLVSRFPDSEWFAEAQFRRGEILFNAGRYAEADNAYQSLLTKGEGEFYEQALFMAGWSRFKQQRYADSRRLFQQLLTRKLGQSSDPQADLERLARADREQVQDLLRAMSLGFSHESGVTALNRYADALPASERRYEPLFYEHLAQFYLDKQRFSDAADSYQAYIDRHPLEPQAPLFHSQLIKIYQRSGFTTQVIRAKVDYIRNYGVDSAFWKLHKLSDWPLVERELKGHISDLAEYYHARAQRERNRGKKLRAYRSALGWYQTMLNFFPGQASTAKSQFGKAEVLFDLGDYVKAAASYEQAAYAYPSHADGAEAAYKALTTYDKLRQSAKGKTAERWQAKLAANAERLADCYPEHPQALAALTQAAEQRFAAGDLDDAWRLAQLAQLAQQRRGGSVTAQRIAWTVSAHVDFDQGFYAEAEQSYEQALRRFRARNRSEQRQKLELQNKLSAAIYQQGIEQREAGEHRKAYELFGRAAQRAPTESLKQLGEYDAATELLALEQWRAAVSQLQAFRRNHPKSRLLLEVARKLALAYEKSQQPQLAAAEYQRLGADPATPDALAREAVQRAAEIFAEGGQSQQAINAYKLYQQRFPTPLEPKLEAQFRIAGLYAKRNDLRRSQQWYRQLIASYRAARGVQRSERLLYLLAQSTLQLAQPALVSYRRVTLREPLQQNLQRKKAAMEQALAALGETAKLGVAEVSTQATFQIADLYHDFSRALMKSERPRGLSSEELEQYDILLEEQAFPFEEKAIELHEVNRKRIREGIYDRWVQQSLKKLAELLPARYAKTERMERGYESAY